MDADSSRKFSLGLVVATPGALAELEQSRQQPSEFLIRHQRGDWGDVGAEDAQWNDRAVSDGTRILSAYRTESGACLWIITDAADDQGERNCTTLLLPSEY